MKFKDLAGFDWNKANKQKNLVKHKVHYKECEEAFINKPAPVYPDPNHSKTEKRYFILSQTKQGRKLFISFTLRKNKIRVISARPMSQKERKVYVKKI